MTRTVTDLALILDIIVAIDTNDSDTTQQKRPPSFSQQLTSLNLDGKHFAIINSVAGLRVEDNMPAETKVIFERFYARLRQMGATVSTIDLKDFDSNRENNMAGEVEDINTYLANFPSTRRDYTDICTSQRMRIFQHGERDCLTHIKTTGKKDSPSYQQALATFQRNRRYVEGLMNQHHYDALLIPITRTGKASYDAKEILTWQLPVSSNSGLPAITVPIDYLGKENLMPVGIEIIGHYFDEMTLLNIAYTLEHVLPPRKAPTLAKPDHNNPLMQASIPVINNFITEIGAETTHAIKTQITPQTLTPDEFRRMVEAIKTGSH